MINIKSFDPNKIKIDEKPPENILTFHNSHQEKNSVKPLCLYINKVNGYIEGSKRKKYLTLVHIDESKDTLKIHEQLWGKVRDLIRSTRNKLGDYDQKYMKCDNNC